MVPPSPAYHKPAMEKFHERERIRGERPGLVVKSGGYLRLQAKSFRAEIQVLYIGILLEIWVHFHGNRNLKLWNQDYISFFFENAERLFLEKQIP